MLQCQLCEKEFSILNTLVQHLGGYHPEISKQEYYDKYLLVGSNNCEYCGNISKFISISRGYNRFCCHSCSTKGSKNIKDDTMILLYGNAHPMHCDGIKTKVQNTNIEKYGNICSLHGKDIEEKTKSTWNKNYGVDIKPTQSNKVKDKILKTNLEKYGVNTPSKNDYVKSKIVITNIEKYGVNCVFKCKEIKDKIKESQIEKYGDLYCKTEEFKERVRIKLKEIDIDIIRTNAILEKYGMCYSKTIEFTKNVQLNMIEKYSFIDDKIIDYSVGEGFTCACKLCKSDYFITSTELNNRLKNDEILCTNCNKINSVRSSYEKEICKIFTENNIEFEFSNRKVLNGLELDIFIPSKNIAIEFNGLYWHSKKFKSNDYHQKKTEECKKLGIQLIHVYEDDWLYKQDIVKSRLKSLLGLSYIRIFARKCEVKELDSKTSKQFLEANHIQSSTDAKYKYGLYFADELVACMTFGHSRYEKTKTELIRFANKLNTNVIGGASKLFKHFLKQNICTSIISYADKSWSVGKLYETLGFKLISNTPPNYGYVIGSKRFNRFKFRKSELVKEGFDINLSENDIMKLRKIYRIYDSGSLKYEYNK